MDEGSQPQPLSAVGRGPSAAKNASNFNVQNEILWIKQDAAQVRNAVLLLEQEKDSLRKAIRKLKLENQRVKQKVKTLQDTINHLKGVSKDDAVTNGATEAELDYDEIGRDFLLIGGVHDPFALRHEVLIRDSNGVEHKSAERYYWYKMAETFNDKEAMRKVQEAKNVTEAEEAMKNIQKFDEKVWNELKLSYWEEGQRLKLQQVRWIANLLVASGTIYIAVASQDKFFGTGWRKNRQEANKPIFWDGENQGGKALMKLRHMLIQTHAWLGPNEEDETQKKYKDLRRFVWRRIDPAKRLQVMATRGRPRGVGGGRRGGGGPSRGYGSGPATGRP